MKVIICAALFIIYSTNGFSRLQREGLQFSFPQEAKDTSGIAIPAAREMLAEIMGTIGLRANFELKEARVGNFEAVIFRRKRYILYNPDYIQWVTGLTHDKWAAMALLAHEVGHHLNGHTLKKSGSKPDLELEADEFAGFILYKSGATLGQAQEVMMHIATAESTRTHPSKTARLRAVQIGWDQAYNKEALIVKAKTE